MVALFAALLSAQSVDDVRARVGAYVNQFTPQFANVVALETYEQTTKAALTGVSSPGAAFGGPAPLATPVTWRFKADLLLVRYPLAELDWMMFRDVTEIDGERVRHEENRLMTLFAEPTIESAQRAARISQESLRRGAGGTRSHTGGYVNQQAVHPAYRLCERGVRSHWCASRAVRRRRPVRFRHCQTWPRQSCFRTPRQLCRR
jgi:hypothetical protein